MQKIFILDINDIKREKERVVAALSESAVLKAESYAYERDKLLSLGGALLVQAFTAKSPLLYNKYKKPYKKEKPFFNVSHSGDKVGIFISDEAEVGFDIQIIKSQSEKLKNYIFSEGEKELINNDTDFVRLWTLKEAAAKCVGTGIVDLKTQILSDIADNSFIFKSEKFYYKNYVTGDYIACACSMEKIKAEVLSITVEFVLKTLANY